MLHTNSGKFVNQSQQFQVSPLPDSTYILLDLYLITQVKGRGERTTDFIVTGLIKIATTALRIDSVLGVSVGIMSSNKHLPYEANLVIIFILQMRELTQRGLSNHQRPHS